jgi:hypothetical protein
MHRTTRMAVMLGTLVWVVPALGDWKEPADKRLTEDELKSYIATADEWASENAKLMAQIKSASSDEEKLAVVGKLDQEHRDCLQRHNMSEAEFNWVAERAMDAWTVATYVDDASVKAAASIKARMEENEANLAEAEKRLESFQEALKAGRRVLSEDEMARVKRMATDDHQAALDEIKRHDEEIKTAQDEADAHDGEAKSEEALAKNPPANISASERDGYVDERNKDAQAARDAAKEARDQMTEAMNAKAAAQAMADAKQKEMDHPEVPVLDEDIAMTKQRDEAGIAEAQSDIGTCQKIDAQLQAVSAQMQKTSSDLQASAPAENVELMRKYSTEYKQLLDDIAGGPTTRGS